MSKILVAFFSASGETAKLSKTFASATAADLHEIVPEKPYTSADLDWRDKNSRSTYEMTHKSERPAVANNVENMEQYDVICVGFPIWWGVAPTIINTFLEQYDLSGKTIVTFATSGGSGIGKTNAELGLSCKGAKVTGGKVFRANAGASELKQWFDRLEVK